MSASASLTRSGFLTCFCANLYRKNSSQVLQLKLKQIVKLMASFDAKTLYPEEEESLSPH